MTSIESLGEGGTEASEPMVIGIAISPLIAFAIARVTLPAENRRLPAAAPEET